MRAKRRNLKQHISKNSTRYSPHTHKKVKVPSTFYRKRRK